MNQRILREKSDEILYSCWENWMYAKTMLFTKETVMKYEHDLLIIEDFCIKTHIFTKPEIDEMKQNWLSRS